MNTILLEKEVPGDYPFNENCSSKIIPGDYTGIILRNIFIYR
jgi:hypothetical protein